MTVSGTNFTGATAVTFNGVSASFTVNSATTIRATVPADVGPGQRLSGFRAGAREPLERTQLAASFLLSSSPLVQHERRDDAGRVGLQQRNASDGRREP